MYDIFEDDWVDVLTEQVDEKPIADEALADDHIDTFALDSPIAHAEHEGPDVWGEDDGNAIHEGEEGEDAEEQKPEPDENVDFLVDNVEWQYAQGIVLFDVACKMGLNWGDDKGLEGKPSEVK